MYFVCLGVPIASPGSNAEGRWELWDEGSMTEAGTPIPPKLPASALASAATPAAAGMLPNEEQPYIATPAGKPPGVRSLASRFAREQQLATAGQLGVGPQPERPDSAGEGRWQLWSEDDGLGGDAQDAVSPVGDSAEEPGKGQPPLADDLPHKAATEVPSPASVMAQELSNVQPTHAADLQQDTLAEILSAAKERVEELSDMQPAHVADVPQAAPAEIASGPEELRTIKPAQAIDQSVASAAEEPITATKWVQELSIAQPAEAEGLAQDADAEAPSADEMMAKKLSKVQPPLDADSLLGTSHDKPDTAKDVNAEAAQGDATQELSPPEPVLEFPTPSRYTLYMFCKELLRLRIGYSTAHSCMTIDRRL